MESLSNGDVSIVHARKYEMVRMMSNRKSPKGSLRLILGHLLCSHTSILLRYVLSVTFCGAAVLKVMDRKKTISLSADEIIRGVYKHLESLPDTSLSFTNL